AAQTVQTGEEHPFGDVRLVEPVAKFPFQLSRNDDFAPQVGVSGEPLAQIGRRVGHDRKQGELVDDAVVDGGRLEKQLKRFGLKLVQVVQRFDQAGEQFYREELSPFLGEGAFELLGQ